MSQAMDRTKDLHKNSFLKFNPYQVQDLRKSYGFNNDKEMGEAVDKLDEWVKKQNHFVNRNFDRDYLEAVILRAKGSMEKAKKRLDKLCTLKTLVPEVFTDFKVRTEFHELVKSIQTYVEPTATSDNYRMMVMRYSSYISPKISLVDIARLANVCSEYEIRNDYVHGFEGIVDITSVSMTSLLQLANPVLLQKFVSILMEGYGVRIKGIHIVSSSKIVDVFVTILKQAMGEKVGSRINVYPDYEALAMAVPKNLLPKEFGGTSKTIDELHDAWLSEVFSEKHQAYIDEVMTWRTDESKRLGETFNQEYLGLPGSFRSLVVD